MSEIGLLMTGILITKRPYLPNNLPKQQPFPMEKSSQKLIQRKLTQLAPNHQITPPEFIQTDQGYSENFKDRNFQINTTKSLSPGSFTLAKATIKVAKVAARPQRFRAQSMPTLRFGNSGTSVRVLQRLLVSNGYAIGVDGAYGPLTETAVKAFQNQRRLSVDGIVGPVTWLELTI
ncbi:MULTISPECIES: peptidoglycan-binding domain-containing protein [unclassified Anabaena]|uniref:peptidoglycan-binding domain-containing protein n=1 Tax=unclassified Anabaena TaxID=2619674 RepID=UPI0039C5E3D6